MPMTSFLDFFDINIGSITAQKNDLIDVKSCRPVKEALQLFAEYKISSLPVYEAPNSVNLAFCSPKDKAYVGIISMADCLFFILRKVVEIEFELDPEMISEILQCSIRDVIGSTPESKEYIGLSIETEETPLSDIVERMCRGKHRCLVFSTSDHSKNSAKILTQTDVMTYFLEKLTLFPQIGNALSHSVRSFLSYKSEEGRFVFVHEDTPLIEAVSELLSHPAVAVVNREFGQVVANLSVSDFEDISSSTDFGAMMSMTVRDYLFDPFDNRYKTVAKCVGTSDTLIDCAQCMAIHHIHRVWAVTEKDNDFCRIGIGCISVTDIIKSVRDSSTIYIAGDYVI